MSDKIKNTYTNEHICENCLMAHNVLGHSSEDHRKAVEANLEGLEDIVYRLDGEYTDEGPQPHFGSGCFSCGDFSPAGNRYNMTVIEFYTYKRS